MKNLHIDMYNKRAIYKCISIIIIITYHLNIKNDYKSRRKKINKKEFILKSCITSDTKTIAENIRTIFDEPTFNSRVRN